MASPAGAFSPCPRSCLCISGAVSSSPSNSCFSPAAINRFSRHLRAPVLFTSIYHRSSENRSVETDESRRWIEVQGSTRTARSRTVSHPEPLTSRNKAGPALLFAPFTSTCRKKMRSPRRGAFGKRDAECTLVCVLRLPLCEHAAPGDKSADAIARHSLRISLRPLP